jgi:alpha-tubulin suppressor-like RCC1 family protein
MLGAGDVPDRLLGLADASALAPGMTHSCAMVAGGTVYCWGSNDGGQIGDGTTVGRPIPTLVPGTLGTAAIEAGDRHTCLLIGGTILCCVALTSIRTGTRRCTRARSCRAAASGCTH